MDNRLVCAVALVIGCCVLAADGLQITSTVSVGDLKTPIRRETCGHTKFCGETPAGCDPHGNSTCLFTSATAATPVMGSRPNVAFELRGDSEDYIVLVLSPNKNLGGNDEAFVCAQYNNTLRFFTATFNNEMLTVTNKTGAVSNVLASLNANVIQCTFTALGLNATASGGSSDTTFYVFAGKGSFVNGTLGNPTITFMSNGSVDLTSLPPRTPTTTPVANTTSVANTTLVTNTTSVTIPVGPLKTPIRRASCGRTKLCQEVPTQCDPSGNGNCLFVSAAPAAALNGSSSNAGTNLAFELRGTSTGYIVLILSTKMNEGGNNQAFVCAQQNSTPRFFTATLNNGKLSTNNRTGAVSDVLASLNGSVIQCTFTALGLNATATKSADTTFFISAGNGTFINGTLGDPKITFTSNSSADLTSLPPQTPTTTPVGPLKTPIRRTSCGRTKLCQEVPTQCDPSGNGNCLFVSAALNGSSSNAGTNVTFELRGTSTGYIVLILSTKMNETGNNQAFVCAQQNSAPRFFTATLNNGKLSTNNRTGAVSNVLASLNASVIQCTFTALGLNATATKSADTSFYISAGNGTFIDGVLGDPTISLRSNSIVDLNSTSNQPTAGGTSLHPVSLVLLVLLSALISRLV